MRERRIHVLNEVGIKSAIATTVSKTNINEIPQLVKVAVDYQAKSFGFSRFLLFLIFVTFSSLFYKHFANKILTYLFIILTKFY